MLRPGDEDGVCLMAGLDDGHPRWHCEFGQEDFGGLVGVWVELRVRPD